MSSMTGRATIIALVAQGAVAWPRANSILNARAPQATTAPVYPTTTGYIVDSEPEHTSTDTVNHKVYVGKHLAAATSVSQSSTVTIVSVTSAAAPSTAYPVLPAYKPSDGSVLSCPSSDKSTFTDSTGNSYTVACYTDYFDYVENLTYAVSLDACASDCSNMAGCVAAVWRPGGSNGPCYLKDGVGYASNDLGLMALLPTNETLSTLLTTSAATSYTTHFGTTNAAGSATTTSAPVASTSTVVLAPEPTTSTLVLAPEPTTSTVVLAPEPTTSTTVLKFTSTSYIESIVSTLTSTSIMDVSALHPVITMAQSTSPTASIVQNSNFTTALTAHPLITMPIIPSVITMVEINGTKVVQSTSTFPFTAHPLITMPTIPSVITVPVTSSSFQTTHVVSLSTATIPKIQVFTATSTVVSGSFTRIMACASTVTNGFVTTVIPVTSTMRIVPTSALSTSSATPTASVKTPYAPCSILNHKGNTFYLRTHVIYGNKEFENLYVQNNVYGAPPTIPSLTTSRDTAAQAIYDHSTFSIAIWHGECTFSGLKLNRDRDLNSWSPVLVGDEVGTSKMSIANGEVWWDNDRFGSWLICKDPDTNVYEMMWWDTITDQGIDGQRCAKVQLLTENI